MIAIMTARVLRIELLNADGADVGFPISISLVTVGALTSGATACVGASHVVDESVLICATLFCTRSAVALCYLSRVSPQQSPQPGCPASTAALGRDTQYGWTVLAGSQLGSAAE